MEVSNSKVKVSATLGKIISAFGYIFVMFFFMMLLIAAIVVELEAWLTCFFMLVIAVLLIMKGIQIKRRIARFRKYTTLISGQRIFMLNEIAVRTSQTLNFVKKDLQNMIVRGYFTDMEIDMAADKVIAGSKTAQAQAAIQANMEKFERLNCQGCGASVMKPKGEHKACEYCGFML